MEENGKTKKVLIISSYSGTRIPGLLKYLPESGWQPVLLTMLGKDVHQPPPGLKIIRTPYRDALSFWKKLFKINAGKNLRTEIKNQFSITSKKSVLDHFLTIGSAIINYPDAEKGWKSFAIKAADELFQREKIDAVISSSSPVTAHIIAGELKKRYKIPWVAALRTPS